jgi:hypothetical protein
MHNPTLAVQETCTRLKKIGYSRFSSVRLYGEVLQLVSDPYSDGKDFLVEVHSQLTDLNRIVRLPKFIVNPTRAA